MRLLIPKLLVSFLTVTSMMDASAVPAMGTEPGGQPAPRPRHVWDAKATAMAFSPDGKTLAVAVDDRTVRLYETASGKHQLSLKGHTQAVTALAVSPDGKLLASASRFDANPFRVDLRLWKLEDGQLIHQVQQEVDRSDAGARFPGPLLAFSPAGELLMFPGKDLSLVLYDPETGKPMQSWKLRIIPTTAVFSPDGETIALGTDDGAHGVVHLFDSRSGHSRDMGAVYSGVLALAFSLEGKEVLASYRSMLLRHDTRSGGFGIVWSYGRRWAAAVSFASGGARVALQLGDNLEVRDTHSGQTLLRAKEPPGLVALAPDGKALATSNKDGKVKLWRIE